MARYELQSYWVTLPLRWLQSSWLFSRTGFDHWWQLFSDIPCSCLLRHPGVSNVLLASPAPHRWLYSLLLFCIFLIVTEDTKCPSTQVHRWLSTVKWILGNQFLGSLSPVKTIGLPSQSRVFHLYYFEPANSRNWLFPHILSSHFSYCPIPKIFNANLFNKFTSALSLWILIRLPFGINSKNFKSFFWNIYLLST